MTRTSAPEERRTVCPYLYVCLSSESLRQDRCPTVLKSETTSRIVDLRPILPFSGTSRDVPETLYKLPTSRDTTDTGYRVTVLEMYTPKLQNKMEEGYAERVQKNRSVERVEGN